MATATDYLKLHFIVLLWSFTAILGILISIPAVEMVFFRTLLAAMGMGAFMLFSRSSFKADIPDILKMLLTGFIVSAHWLSFFAAGRVGNASVSLVGFATASLWTAFIEPLSHGRKIKSFEVVLGCVVIAGLYIIFSFEFEYKLGLMLGILAGLTSAVFSVINSKLVRRIETTTITFYEMTGACMATALFFPFYKVVWAENGMLQLSPTSLDWLYITILALVCSVYAFTVMVELMKRVSVFLIQLTLNLEPVYGIVMAVLILGGKEKMQLNFYIGTLVILGAVISYPYLKRRYDKLVVSKS
jgi:drug/metabolite transporter (DMT)-like permease